MCGIVGSLRWGSPDPSTVIQQMIQALNHRGPDALGIKKLGPLTLAHARLSIIDNTAAANQPMQDHTGRYWIVFNGEIYNHQKVKAELKSAGHQFNTRSDTEVILEAYKRWGVDCLKQFIGMFAFALWDIEKQTLFIARDRMGEKPLYYSVLQGPGVGTGNISETDIIFASELKSLLLHPEIGFNVNKKALNEFLSLNYVLTDSCIIDNVAKLPPAHYLFLEPGKDLVIKKYWDLNHFFLNKKEELKNINKADAIDKLNSLIEDSVQQQMISDVPLGAFLSGGIDSSTIVRAMTAKGNAANTKTFSIGFQEKSYNELEESQSVANHLGVSHHTQIVDTFESNLLELLPNIILQSDEPFADSSMIPTYFLAKFAKEKVKVCLSGDGGDELFAGYETYAADKMHRLLRFFPKKILHAASTITSGLLPVSHQKISFDYKIKKFLQGCLHDFQFAHYFWRTIFTESEKSALVHPDLQKEMLKDNPFLKFKTFYSEVEGCHPLDQASYVDIKTWLVDDILVKVDRFSMAHSLETRAPFLDHRIVEFAATLPTEWKMKGFEKKHILKESQKGKLTNSILYRAKKGFNAPISGWFTKDLQTLGRDVTLGSGLEEWFSRKVIENLWQEHLNGKKDHGLKLLGLTSLGLWLQHYRSLSHSSSRLQHSLPIFSQEEIPL